VVTRGIIYVAYGDQARTQVHLAVKSLRQQHPLLPVRVVCDSEIESLRRFGQMAFVYHEDTDPGARLVKLNVDTLSPFDHTLYLDADTRVQGDITYPFELIDNGWEMAMVPCRRQDEHSHAHVNEKERHTTFEEVGQNLIALQGGVIYFRKCEAVSNLFAAWREEWGRFADQDQAALIRALVRCPVRLFLLGRAYNGGGIIRHFYTYARRGGLQYAGGYDNRLS